VHENLPPRFEGTLLLGRGRQLGYAEFGDPRGRPLLWFHGTPGARRQVAPDARVAAVERGIRLISVERPGIGASTAHLYGSLVEWAADIEALCDALALERVAVAGLSGGGPYTLACAHEMPDRVIAAAVLGSPAPSVGDDAAPGGPGPLARALSPLLSLTHWPAGAFLTQLVRVIGPLGEQAMDLFASFMPPGDQRVFADPRMRHMFLDDMLLGSREQMRAFLFDAVLFGRHWGFSLADIGVPVHLWYGDADNIVPLAHGHHIAERIPNAVLRIRPEEGHLGGLGASGEIFDAILEHWTDGKEKVVGVAGFEPATRNPQRSGGSAETS
jgi:pimeloyl-ACP methyl ester carboxylesterase